MLISAEFATANIAMNGKTASSARPGAPASTTLSSGVAPSLSSSSGTSATAVTETST